MRATDPDPATSHYGLATRQSATEVLIRVRAREGADLSAHEVRERASRQATSWAVLAPEYNTIAQEAQHQRWDEVFAGCGLDERALKAVRGSPAFGPLLASMREAEAQGLNLDAVLPRLVHARKFDDATDPAAVLHGRVQRWTAAAASKRRGPADLVAGLLPRAKGVADPDMGRALAERDQAMCQRAREMAGSRQEQPSLGGSTRAAAHGAGGPGTLGRGGNDRRRLPGPLGGHRRRPTSRPKVRCDHS